MKSEQMLEAIKEHIDRRYFQLLKEINAVKEHVFLNENDAETIRQLQKEVNDGKKELREMEIENYFEHRHIKP